MSITIDACVAQHQGDRRHHLGPAGPHLDDRDLLGVAAEHCAGPETMERIDTAATRIDSSLHQCEAWPVLRHHLALLALEGENPANLLQRVAASGGLNDARCFRRSAGRSRG